MEAVLFLKSDPAPANLIQQLAYGFTVPLGTTDLSSIDIPVFTVRPGSAPVKGIFER